MWLGGGLFGRKQGPGLKLPVLVLLSCLVLSDMTPPTATVSQSLFIPSTVPSPTLTRGATKEPLRASRTSSCSKLDFRGSRAQRKRNSRKRVSETHWAIYRFMYCTYAQLYKIHLVGIENHSGIGIDHLSLLSSSTQPLSLPPGVQTQSPPLSALPTRPEQHSKRERCGWGLEGTALNWVSTHCTTKTAEND